MWRSSDGAVARHGGAGRRARVREAAADEGIPGITAGDAAQSWRALRGGEDGADKRAPLVSERNASSAAARAEREERAEWACAVSGPRREAGRGGAARSRAGKRAQEERGAGSAG